MPAKNKRRIRAVVEEVGVEPEPQTTTPVPAAEQKSDPTPETPKPQVKETTEQKIESAEEKARRALAELEALKSSQSQPETTPAESASSDAQNHAAHQPPEVNHPVHHQPTGGNSEDKSDGVSIKLIIMVAVFTAIVVAVVSGGVYVYYTGITNQAQQEALPTPSPTPIPTLSPTPTPEPEEEYDLEDYEVSILNGSGQIGAAGDASDVVEAAGFVVGDTGNAASFGFTDTIIKAKKSVPDGVIEELKESLSEVYSVTIGDNLGATDDFDIVVTVGTI